MMEYGAFEGDAFAPLVNASGSSSYFPRSNPWAGFGAHTGHQAEAEAGPSDPWARMRMAGQLGGSGQAQGQGSAFGVSSTSGSTDAWGRPVGNPSAFAQSAWNQSSTARGDSTGQSGMDVEGGMNDQEDEDADMVDQAVGGWRDSAALSTGPSTFSNGLGINTGYAQPVAWPGWGGQVQAAGGPDQWDRGRR